MDNVEKAANGLVLLKEAIVEALHEHSDGLSNAEIAEMLDIRSDYRGSQKDYLSWSVLGLLLNEERVVRRGRKYFAQA